MTNISLRTYTREIEKLIDNNQADQGLAHCRHILKSYPKCVDAYRLLGKAYLEGQRYGDAADIFQRVLSSVPDDFVSHVGMSLIREDEGNLDQAIWHMERAFEVQPANAAIQGELRRLYGRRDGMEPPKIRLTRGALARMYARGELFQQAVAEIRTALAEDPNRLDLITLLASVYAQAGQKAEAVEMCNGLLRKLPYSLEGNRIMSEMLKDTDRVQDLQVYKRRLVALNPYFAHLSPSAPSVDRVPDQSVTIERLQWSPGMTVEGPASQPEWAASLGVQLSGMTSEKDILPDWLLNLEESASEKGKSLVSGEPGKSASPFDNESLMQFARETQKAEPPADKTADAATKPLKPSPEEVIPEWMKEAGWQPSSGEAREEESLVSLGGEDDFLAETAGEPGLAEAKIPEWLKAMAPPDTAEAGTPEDSGGELAWLDGLQVEQPADQVEAEGESERVEDWLADSKVEVPDWLKELDEEKPADEMPPTKPLTEKPAAEEPETEEWLQETAIDEDKTGELLPAESPGEESVPDWLLEGMSGPDARSAGPKTTLQSQEEPASGTGEQIPEWLRDFTPKDEAAQAGEAAVTGEIPEWLHSLAPDEEEAASPVVEEVAIEGTQAPEAIESAESPAQLEEEALAQETPAMQAESEAQAEIQPVSEGEPSGVQKPSSEEEPPAWDIEGTDDAFAWLESLAVKQGAEEALLLNPDERKETPPDWVQADLASQAGPSEEAAIGEPAAEMAELTGEIPAAQAPETAPQEVQLEEEAQGEAEAAEIPDWLQELGPQATEEADTGEIEAGLPDWIKAQPEIEVPEPAAEEVRAKEEPPAEVKPAEVPDWLQALEAQGAEPTEVEQAPQAVEAELPDWIKSQPEMEVPEPAAEEGRAEEVPPIEVEPAEVPDWLQALEAQGADEIEGKQAVEGILPSWLSEESGIEAPEPLAEEAHLEEEAQAEAEPAEIPDWLQALEPQGGDEKEEAQAEPPAWTEAGTMAAGLFSEGPPIMGDTQPVKVHPSVQPPAAEPEAEPEVEVSVEAETASQEAPQAALETGQAPEEIEAEAWSAETAVPPQAAYEAEPAEEPELLPTAGLEAEVFQEAPVEGTEEPIAAIDEWRLEEPEVAPSEDVAAMLSEMQESDEAFAWLESLAVRQGADEALLLSPEERAETPPEWVQAEVEGAEEQGEAQAPEEALSPEEPIEMEAEAETEEMLPPTWMAEEQPAVPETEEDAALALDWSLEPVAAVTEEEQIPAWPEEEVLAVEEQPAVIEQPAAIEQPVVEELSAEEPVEIEEQPAALEQPAAEVEAGEEIPELPDWLQEGAAESGEEIAWTPPAIERQLEKLDLNQASLVELERLPDIGFRMAQNIVNYRDTFGAFKSVDDLLNIPGLGPEMLADVREWLYVTPQPEEAPETPSVPFGVFELGEAPTEVVEARRHLAYGDLEQAAQSYTQLIKSNLHLEAIIQDLQVATRQNPQDIHLWQALGDAQLRAGQIQLALDAYNQAEKLLR